MSSPTLSRSCERARPAREGPSIECDQFLRVTYACTALQFQWILAQLVRTCRAAGQTWI
uniref:Uncharacterized protein n=1 Tax=Arundo donax TaxID=35708 RepID=A0A0A9CD21_ARUDO